MRIQVLLLLMFNMVCYGLPSLSHAQNRPNIILILSDDHSARFLGAYGNPDLKTPNLDKLASAGIKFNRAYTTAPQCVLSRASIMTGRSVLDIRMSRFSAPLPADVATYPELLRKAGYYTGICGRTYHLDGGALSDESEAVFNKFNLRTFKDRVDYLRTGSNEDALPQFMEFVDQVPKGKPFFVQVGYHDPHRIFNATDFEPDPSKISVPEGMPDTKELRKDLAGYYGEIQRLDHQIGLLLEEIEKRGFTQNTLIMFMGDNGGALLRGKGTLYELGIHVPLIARWPGKIGAGLQSDALISGEDLAPTFLEAAGISIPTEMTGRSFAETFKDPDKEIREFAFAVRGAHGSGLPNSSSNFDLGRAVFNKRYKLIYNATWQLPYYPVDFGNQPFWGELTVRNAKGELNRKYRDLYFAESRAMFELFDLSADPYELSNLAGTPEYSKIEQELKAELLEWMILNEDYLPLPILPRSKR